MRKLAIYIVCTLLFSCNLIYGNEIDIAKTQTVYNEENTFETVSKMKVDASFKTVDAVINKFISDLTYNPNSLFDNLLEGLGSQEEGKDIFLINYKECTYDKKTNLYTGVLDILMGNTCLSNIEFKARITKKIKENGQSEAIFELIDVNPILKRADGKIIAKKIGNQIDVTLIANFKFGWLFNMFFSMKNYKNVAEWRIDKFMDNLNEEILLQEKKQIVKN